MIYVLNYNNYWFEWLLWQKMINIFVWLYFIKFTIFNLRVKKIHPSFVLVHVRHWGVQLRYPLLFKAWHELVTFKAGVTNLGFLCEWFIENKIEILTPCVCNFDHYSRDSVERRIKLFWLTSMTDKCIYNIYVYWKLHFEK